MWLLVAPRRVLAGTFCHLTPGEEGTVLGFTLERLPGAMKYASSEFLILKKKHKWLKQASCNFLAEILDRSSLSLFTPVLKEQHQT